VSDLLLSLPVLSLDRQFLAGSSLEELARARQVQPITDVSQLAGGFPPNENIDKFLEDIYDARR
jgi:hypothetical protein